MIMFSLFAFLFIRKKISASFYLIYFVCSLLLSLTMSKNSLVIFIVINLWLFVSVFIKFKIRLALVIVPILIALYSITFAIFPSRGVAYWCRLLNIPYDVEQGVQSSDEDKPLDQYMSELTTGRTDIWRQYLDKILI